MKLLTSGRGCYTAPNAALSAIICTIDIDKWAPNLTWQARRGYVKDPVQDVEDLIISHYPSNFV